jgi:hypothetical protein
MKTTSFGDIHATRHSDHAATRGAALLSEVVEAHGGAARWAKAQTVSSHVQVRGLLPTWKFPGRPLEDYQYHQKVDIHGLRNVMHGFPTPSLPASSPTTRCGWNPTAS